MKKKMSDESVAYTCLILGLVVGIVLTCLVDSVCDLYSDQNYVRINKEEIVERGFGTWSYDKKLILKTKAKKYYFEAKRNGSNK